MRAIVVGAGIAGLVAARQLGLAGWEVDVVERSQAPRPDGYMMDFFGPGYAAADTIGLLPRLLETAYRVDSADYIDSEGRTTARFGYEQFARIAGGKLLSLLRPDVELACVAALDDVPSGRVRLHYGATPVRIWADDGGTGVEFSTSRNGQQAKMTLEADLLVGADGIHSAVRAAIFGAEEQFLRPLGMRTAAYIVRDPDLGERFEGRFILTDTIDRQAGLYTLRDGRTAAFLVYRDSDGAAANGTRQRLQDTFAGIGPIGEGLLELCPEDPYDDVVAQVAMPQWHKGRAVLIGDACQAVSLLAGQGASLAVAGAALLADVLQPLPEGASSREIEAALDDYQQQWRPIVEETQAVGRRAASSFLPASRIQLLARRWTLRLSGLPGIDRILARQIVGRLVK